MAFVTLENFEHKVLNSDRPCVVTFKNEGCHLCRGLRKVIARLENKFDNKLRFFSVDSLEEEGLSELFKVDGVPTMFMFVNGDGREIPYPEDPSHFTGYKEEDLVVYLNDVLGL